MTKIHTRFLQVLLTFFVFTTTALAAPYMSVNGANADYLTLNYYINEPHDSETIYVDFWPNEANVVRAQVWGNLNRRDRATLGNQDWASIPGPDASSTNYFVGIEMTQGEGGRWYVSLPINKTGAYRLNARYQVDGDPVWRWAGIRDTAVMVSPKKARDVILYELQVNVINATGDTEGTRSTFEDLMDPTKPANLDYFENLGVNTLWIQPIHPIGQHHCIDVDGPGSPYSIQNMWEVAPHMSQGNTREASMAAFTNFAAAAGERGIDFFFDIIFNHTSWDAEIGMDPNNPRQPASNPSAKIADILPQWYSRYVGGSLPCGEYDYNQADFHYWLPARNAGEIGPAPAERNDFGKWPDVADLFWGTYPSLFDPQTDTDAYWDISQQGADVERMVEYFAYFGEYWIEKSGGTLGGFRCDYAQGIPPQAWEYIVNRIRQVKWDFIFMAESLDGGNVSKRAGRHMDIINQNWVWQVLGNGGNTSGLRGIIDANKTDYGYAGIMRGLINHDQNAPEDVWYSFSRYAVGAVVDGAPQLYQGQELGYRNNYGFSQFRFQFERWIPHIFKWHNMQTLWNERIGILEDAYRRVNHARLRSPVLRLHDQWYLDRTHGQGPHQQIFSVLKYEGARFGWDPAHQNVVLAFVNLTPWTGQSGTFQLAGVEAIYLNPTRHYNIRNLAADDPNAYLWADPGRTGQDLLDNGIFVDMPADGNANPATAFVQVLRLEEHGGGGEEPSTIEWVGNTSHTPPNGSIGPTDDIVVYIESYPEGTAVSGDVVYSPDGGSTWLAEALVWGGDGAGEFEQNDWWTANLGQFPECTVIQYAVVLRDGDNNEVWDNNNGQDYFAEVICDGITLHNVSHTPPNGAITPDTAISVYVETDPLDGAVSASVAFQVNGGDWQGTNMVKGGVTGGRDWWTVSLGQYAACSTVRYAVVARDVAENEFWANNKGKDYWAYVNCAGLAITNPPMDVTVGNATDSYDVQGSLYGGFLSDLYWTNSATGATGSVPAAASWNIAGIALNVGPNPIVVTGIIPGGPEEVVVAEDNSGNYDAGWFHDEGQGTGFGVWTFAHDQGDGWAGSDIWDPTAAEITGMGTEAFGMGANPTNSGANAEVIRAFSSPLNAGEVFRFDLGLNWDSDQEGSNRGFVLFSDETELININMANSAVITINGETMFEAYGAHVMTLHFEYVASGSIRVWGTGRDTVETYDETLDVDPSAPSGFKFYFNASHDGEDRDKRQMYFDNLAIVKTEEGAPQKVSDSVTITRQIGYDEYGDDDGDGIPNWWEDVHFGGPTNAVASALAANQLNTLLETYIAGLDPHNPDAFLDVHPMTVPAVGLEVRWPSVAGRVYQVHRATNLVDGFAPLQIDIPATPPVNTYHDEEATGAGPYFYYIRVKIAE